MKKYFAPFFFIFYFIFFFIKSSYAIEIIRDTELENFTDDLLSILLDSEGINIDELNIYFINSDQVNAFVTGGKNIFINTEVIIEADDYREYAAVLAHELAHILGGHIFNTTTELSNLSSRALPIYLLGIIGIIAGSAETGLAGVMVGQASVSDGFTYYSRTQEASADQSAVKILCKNNIDAQFLINFLRKLESFSVNTALADQNYRSTHPLIENRVSWISSALKNNKNCNHKRDNQLQKRFELVKAKIHGFTHSYNETESIYGSNEDIDLYANAVAKYFQGNHAVSINNLELLIKSYPKNPYYKELLGEIMYANHDYENAAKYQLQAINEIRKTNDLYFMMIGNYLLSINEIDKIDESIRYLKKSLFLNSKNAYSWYLLARAYSQIDEIALANYATAERYYLIGERALSYDFAMKAVKNINENSPEWYRSYDLIEILKKEVLNNN